ncbi:MAG: Gfo/Idh/MocA family protein [Paracoccaceae bacterium]|jgi:predicted dehydrogenase
MSFCVVGGGKMGLSHLALITPYLGKGSVALVEPKRSVRVIFSLMGYRTYSSLDQALKQLGRLSGIIIATPTSSHAPLAEWAISRKIPCFVEKPLTLDVERSRRLLDLADQSDVFAQTGFVMRYVATYQRVKTLVDTQQLGALRRYNATMRGNVMTKPPKPENWQGSFRRGGGCLNEYGPHIIDLCRFVFGNIREVRRAEYGRVMCEDADDWVDLDWTHDSNVTGQLKIDWADSTKRKSVIEIQAEFEYATVRADNSAFDIVWEANAPLDEASRAAIESHAQPPNVGFYLRGEEFSLELEDFLGRCLNKTLHVDPDAPTGITPTLQDGFAVDQLIHDIAEKADLK